MPDEVIPESLRGRPDAFGREVAAGEAQRWIDAWCGVEVGDTIGAVVEKVGDPVSVFFHDLEQTSNVTVAPQMIWSDEKAGVTLVAEFGVDGISTRLASSGQVSPAGCDSERSGG